MTTHVNDKIFKSCSPITKVVTHSKLVNRPAWESCLKLMYSIHGSSRHFCLRVENCLPQQNNSGKRQDCLMQTIWAASLSVEINGSINPRIDLTACKISSNFTTVILFVCHNWQYYIQLIPHPTLGTAVLKWISCQLSSWRISG